MWKYYGQQRPDFALEPGPGQESVWDYPRPPALVESDELVEVFAGHQPLASSLASLRMLETASPPTYYIAAADINWNALVQIEGSSFCEWKGEASYWALVGDPQQTPIAWLYANPNPSFARIDGHASFYPGRVNCFVNNEPVQPQPGHFYGGWITNRVCGPFKGNPGTGGW